MPDPRPNRLSRLLLPGVLLMQRLRLPAKLALTGLVLVLPLLLLTAQHVGRARTDLQVVADELQGATVAEALLGVAGQVQTYRGLNNRVLSGDAAAATPRDQARTALLQAMARLDGATADAWGLRADWAPVRDALAALTGPQAPTDRVAAFGALSTQVDALRRLQFVVGERSGLLLDPEAQSFFLMNLLVQHQLPWTEALGQMRGVGAGLLARGEANPNELASVAALALRLSAEVESVASHLGAYGRAGGAPLAAWDAARQASADYAAAAKASFGSGPPQGTAQAWFAQGTQAIAQAQKLGEALQQQLRAQLLARAAATRQALWLSVGLSAAGLLLLAYLAAAFSANMLGALARLRSSLAEAARGNLAQHAEVPGRDEVADMARDLGR